VLCINGIGVRPLIITIVAIAYPVVKGNKGTGLSNAEKLGECSMPAKVV